MFWNKYPYTDFHELNLDMILRMIKDLNQEWDEFKVINAITFDGEWDITKQYPAWCIVNWNNGQDGYISIRPVPAGVTIDNTEYWASVVNYTATIADLQNRVVALEGDVSTLEADVKGRAVNNVTNRKMLFVGDSYSLSDGSWTFPVWHENIVSNLGLTGCISLEADGGGFADPANSHNPGYNGLTWGQILQTYFTHDDDITDVVVAGGYNDHDETRADIVSGITLFVNTARSLYPNAKIWISYIGWSNNYSTNDTIMEKAYTYYKYAALEHGCEFIETNGCWGYSDELEDSIHPNGDGQYHIGLLLSAALMGGEFRRLDEKAISTTLQFGTGTLPLTLYQDGNDLYFNNDATRTLTLSGYTITSGSWVKLAKLNDVIPVTPYQCAGTIPLRIDATDNTIYFITASAAIENGDLYIQIPAGMATNTLRVCPFRIHGKFWGAKYY